MKDCDSSFLKFWFDGGMIIYFMATRGAKDQESPSLKELGEGGSLMCSLVTAYFISGSILQIKIVCMGETDEGLLSGRVLSVNSVNLNLLK